MASTEACFQSIYLRAQGMNQDVSVVLTDG